MVATNCEVAFLVQNEHYDHCVLFSPSVLPAPYSRNNNNNKKVSSWRDLESHHHTCLLRVKPVPFFNQNSCTPRTRPALVDRDGNLFERLAAGLCESEPAVGGDQEVKKAPEEECAPRIGRKRKANSAQGELVSKHTR